MARTRLQEFAYRIEIGWWIFALARGLALVIALLRVSYQGSPGGADQSGGEFTVQISVKLFECVLVLTL